MAATLTLDWYQLLWYLQGGMSGSHLRWGIYKDFVDIVFPQLSEEERELIFTYAKRDLDVWSKFEINKGSTDEEYFRRLLARFNPANQYALECDNGDEHETVQAYLYEGKYYVGWNRFADKSFIKSATQKPYKKCRNFDCKSKDKCLRHTTFKEGDETYEDGAFPLEKCDYIIENNETQGL